MQKETEIAIQNKQWRRENIIHIHIERKIKGNERQSKMTQEKLNEEKCHRKQNFN
jgi:hypothetical protein